MAKIYIIDGNVDDIETAVGNLNDFDPANDKVYPANGSISNTTFAAGAIDDAALASDAEVAIATAVADYIVESQGSITLQQAMSVILSAVAGQTANAGLTFKDPSGAANRIVAVVNAINERTSITLTAST